MLTYFLTALGLAMDAFAVCIASGICIPNLRFRYSLRASLFFGAFQFLMPLIGYAAGAAFRTRICGFDHWIAFGLLAFVGGRMVQESLTKKPESCDDEESRKLNILDLWTLLVLSVATSIDALAVGLSYSVLREPVFPAVAIIGTVTFLLSLAGCEFGKRLGSALERWAGIIGGLVLIGIGTKVLVQHLCQGL